MKLSKKGAELTLNYMIKFVILLVSLLVIFMMFSWFTGEGKIFDKVGGFSDYADSQSGLSTNSGSQSFEEVEENLKAKLTSSEISYLDKFIEDFNLNRKVVYSIIDIESSGKKEAVRFECSIYNNKDNKYCINYQNFNEVDCSSSDDTSKEAFERAYADNKERAICASSFGLFQIMGFHTKDLTYTDEEYFKEKALGPIEDQLRVFELYFKNVNSQFGTELVKQEPDVDTISKLYNGENYKDNNYDDKLKQRLS